jgi:micrococcal nuclease
MKISLPIFMLTCLLFAIAGSKAEVQGQSNCDRAYPDVCIPSPPPDLDCKDISYRNFRVLQPDPHKFDEDKDGIGCETGRRQR